MKDDVKKQIRTYTARRGEFAVVEVPALTYLMVDGHGDPNTSAAYGGAIAAIYPLAYGLKFLSKDELGRDYVVMPLEALWWADDMASFTSRRDTSRWRWTLLNMVPDWITPDHLDRARDAAAGSDGVSRLGDVRLERYDEGLCVQTLHIGPYDDEGPTLDAMHNAFLPEHSLRRTGKHHEIYLSDSRRTPADKLKTILRQPVARSS